MIISGTFERGISLGWKMWVGMFLVVWHNNILDLEEHIRIRFSYMVV